MPRLNILRDTSVIRTPRLLQMEGIFDVAPSDCSSETWTVNFDLPETWNIGLIVGPSGSGKSTVAQEVFGENLVHCWDWPVEKSIVDGFPLSMTIKDITMLLSSVGFSSPPSWVRPFHVLSNGEQFRVNMARTLAEMPTLSVVDEFTSVVDRTVAQVGSAAIAKTVRSRGQKFVAVTCHYDVAAWLEPDWVYQPHTGEFTARRSERRPSVELVIRRVHSSAWAVFRKHHYLNHELNKSAVCFCAFWQNRPVAFASVLHFPHPSAKNIKREHRTVCLPDFQGIGIGNALSDFVASLCRGRGYRYQSQTGHPAIIRSRNVSPSWSMLRKPSLNHPLGKTAKLQEWKTARQRITVTFEYVGAAMDAAQASLVWNS